MRWKVFQYRCALKKVLFSENMEKGFNIGIHWKWFYYRHSLERVLV